MDGEGKPPQELLYAFRTEKWGSPTGSGWLEWEAGLISKMTYCLNVYNSLKAKERWLGEGRSIVDFANENPDMWQIVTAIIKLQNDLKEVDGN